MRPNETERTLKEMLDAAGVDATLPEPMATWRVFKQFAEMPVEEVASEDGDMCLFQWGTHDWGDGRGERFEIDFLRQFMIEVDGEYDHIEQLHCTFEFERRKRSALSARASIGSQATWPTVLVGLRRSLPLGFVREPPARPRMARVEQEEV